MLKLLMYVIGRIVVVVACCCSMGQGCSTLVEVDVDVGVGVGCSLGVGRTYCYIGVGFYCSLVVVGGSLGQVGIGPHPRRPELLAQRREQCHPRLLWGLFFQSATSF